MCLLGIISLSNENVLPMLKDQAARIKKGNNMPAKPV